MRIMKISRAKWSHRILWDGRKHAIPSRMTIAQLCESTASKASAIKGVFIDGTVFAPLDIRAHCDELEQLGYTRYGYETMVDGMTGNLLDIEVFIGPTAYARLQKYVVDELYSISSGPTCMLTRQPVEGRAHGGALRIGEMEQSVIITHGSSHLLSEKFREDSDGYTLFVCRTCQQIPIVNEEREVVRCPDCAAAGTEPEIYKVRTTWSTKLLFHEMMSMGVGVKIGLEPHQFEEYVE
jgi:DNA-directed RNA polymerase beta subunit